MGAICALGLFYACTDIAEMSSPGGPNGSHRARVGIAPSYSYVVQGSYMGDPINRIRLTARNKATNEIVGTLLKDVTSDADNWDLALDVNIDGQVEVIVTIELINVTGGVEAVQWSGQSNPIPVAPAQTTAPTAPVQLFQGPLENLAVKSVRITAGTLALQEGSSTQFQATVDGPPASVVIWNTRNGGVVTIDQSGRATAVRDGSTWIVAQAGPMRDSVNVSVSQRIASIVITPDSQRVATLGADAAFTARVVDPRGATVVGASVNWTIADAAIADNTGNGHFRTKANGRTQVTATSVEAPSIRGNATLIVAQRATQLQITPSSATLNAIGAKQSFSAAVRDASGNTVNQAIRWSSSNGAIATIDANGQATATGVGTVTITASSGTAPDTVFSTASLQVTQNVASLEIAPASATLDALGDTAQFSTTAKDANGNVVPNVKPTWSSTNTSAVTVDDNGRAIAAGNGASTITAVVGTLRASGIVSVQQKVTTVTVTPTPPTMTVLGGTLQLTATAKDRRAAVVTGAKATWSSVDATIVSVDTTGKITAKRNGTTTIRATVDGVIGSVAVMVSQSAPSRVVVSPDSAVIGAVGQTAQFSGSSFDSNNAPMTVKLTWTSLDPSIATVDSTGKVTAVAMGRARIVAANGAADTAIAVVAGPDLIALVSFSKTTLSGLNDSTLLTITVRNIGTANAGASKVKVQFFNAATGLANGDSALAVPATAPGQSQVFARWMHGGGDPQDPDSAYAVVTADAANEVAETNEANNTATSAIVHLPPHLAGLDAQPDSIVFTTLLRTAPLTTRLFDSNGNTVSGATIRFFSMNPGIASVDSLTGVVTARAGGVVFVKAFAQQLPFMDSVKVRVSPVPFSIVANPTSRNALPGDTFHVGSTVRDSANNILNFGRTWSSSDTTIAKVDNTGFVRVIAGGTAILTVRAGTFVSATVTINAGGPNLVFAQPLTVTPAIEGSPMAFSGIVRNVGNANAGPSIVSMRLIDPSNNARLRTASFPLPSMTTAPADSVVVGMSILLDTLTNWPDVVRVIVVLDSASTVPETNEGDNNFTTVTDFAVRFRVVGFNIPNRSITISTLGGSAPLNAMPIDRKGRNLVRPVTYVSSDTTVAKVDGTGLVAAVRNGNATITVTSEGRSDNVAITVAIPPSNIVSLIGNDQTTTVNTDVSDPLGVQVVDANGVAVSGVQVTWTAGEGTLAMMPVGLDVVGVGFRPVYAPFVSVTDANGIARAHWKLGTRAGLQNLTACVAGGCATFRGRGRADKAFKANKNSATDNQEVVVNRVAPNAFEVTVLDQFNNPTRGTVVWDVAGRGTLTSPATAVIDTLTGKAVVTWQLPTVKGQYTINFTVKDETGATVTTDSFHANAKPDKPNQHTRSGGDNQVVTVAQNAANALELTIADQFGNAVSGAVVNWALRAGHVGGTLAAPTSVTDANGRATISWSNVGTKSGAMFVDYTIKDADNTTVLVAGSFKADVKADRPRAGSKRKGDNPTTGVTVGTVAPDSLVLEVNDQYGNPVAGATVNWTAPAGSLSATSTTTDANGITMVAYTLDGIKGNKSITASVMDGATVVATQAFTIKGNAGAPNGVTKKNGGGITLTVAPSAGDQLRVQLVDQYGNGVDNLPVLFEVKAGGGTVNGQPSATVTSDADGYASVAWVMGTKAGAHKARATVASINAFVDFDNTANADHPRGGVKKSGDNSTTTVGSVVGNTLLLEVNDQYGNPVAGATVNWAAPAGTVSAASTTTDANGNASVTYNPDVVKGNKSVTATVMDGATPVATQTFTIKANPDAPRGVSKKNGGGITLTVAPSASDQLKVQMVDQYGNGVDNLPVVFEVKSGGGTVNGQTSVSVIPDVDGFAAVTWVMGTKSGAHKVRATVASINASVDFDNTANADRPRGGVKKSGDNSTTTVGSVVGNTLLLEVNDQYGNPVAGATVNWAAPAGTVSSASTTTDANGNTGVTYNPDIVKGNKSVTATVMDGATPVATQTFTIKANPDAPRGISKKNGGGITLTVAPSASDQLKVQLVDQYGNGVDNLPVVFEVKSGGGTVNGQTSVTVMPDVDGFAAATWVMGTKSGAHKVRATVASINASVDFDNTANADRPKSSTKQRDGNSTTGVTVGTINGDTLILLVMDQYGNPVSGASVQWSADAGTLPVAITTTGTDGTTRNTFNVGERKGTQTVTARVLTGDVPDAQTFRIKANADKPARGNKDGTTDEQIVTVAQTAPAALRLSVQDRFGNSADGVTVLWSLREPQNEGSLSAGSTLTDANGVATVTWNVGKKAGNVYVDYVIKDANGTELIRDAFRASAKAGAAKNANVANNSQSGVVASTLNGMPQVTITDDYGNPVSGIRVNWTPANNAGTASPTSSITGSDGIARTSWTLGNKKGTVTLTATINWPDRAATSVQFTAEAQPGQVQTVSALSASVNNVNNIQLRNTPSFTVSFANAMVDEFQNLIESKDVTWGLCTGSSTTGCTPSTSTTAGSIAASTAVSSPPQAVVTLVNTGTLTVVAYKSGLLLGSVTVIVK